MLEMVGTSFTGSTVRLNMALAVAAPSLTLIVMVAVPNWFAAGLILIVRFAPLPPKRMLPAGARIGFEEPAPRIKLVKGVSMSPTVTGIDSTVSSFIVWFGIAEIVGASFTALTVRLKLLLLARPSPSRTVTVIVARPF